MLYVFESVIFELQKQKIIFPDSKNTSKNV